MHKAEQTTLARLTKGEKLPDINDTNGRIAQILSRESGRG